MEYLMIWLLFGIVAMVIANSKERSGCGWLLLGCLVGPFSLVVAALPSLKLAPDAPSPRTHIKCPDCAEPILIDAKVCKHCGFRVVAGAVPDPVPDGKKRCSDCNCLNDARDKHCAACGFNLMSQ